ncbi:MAG TPA: gamma-glutamylcyclotransferase family protein [Longimicrobiales bacterium]
MSGFNLFVYGTLRSGMPAHERLAGCAKITDASVQGTLYDIDGRFTALLPYGSDVVEGEVWRCPAELLPVLDEYEGTRAGVFRRIGAEVATRGGDRFPCWLYAAGPALSRWLTPDHRIRPVPSVRRGADAQPTGTH